MSLSFSSPSARRAVSNPSNASANVASTSAFSADIILLCSSISILFNVAASFLSLAFAVAVISENPS